MIRCLFLERNVQGSNTEPIKSPSRCQRLITVEAVMCGLWRKAEKICTAHSCNRKGIY